MPITGVPRCCTVGRTLAAAVALTLALLVRAEGVDVSANSITIAISTEPPTLDSSLVEDAVSGVVLCLVNEGLVRFDARGRLQPGVAEQWDLTSERAMFRLREEARWALTLIHI